MEDTGTTALNWEALQREVYRLADEFECRMGEPANVLYLGWEEHMALAKWVSPACTGLCSRSGHLLLNGWRVISVTEKNWLNVGRYNGPT